MIVRVLNFIIGLSILLGFYFVGVLIVKAANLTLPPAIIGLILFSICLITGWVKERWVEDICNLLLKHMPMFFVPFIGGLIAYKTLLKSNLFLIAVVIFITTTLTIVCTGVFVEYGLKFLRKSRL